jgi:hypothetical protein
MTIPKLPGQAPTPEQEQMLQDMADQWRRVGNEAPVQAITRAEEAAKQLIGLNTGLQGIFFAVFAFSDLRKQIGAIHISLPSGLILLFFFLPILCWLISLYCATRVFVPQARPGVNLNNVSVGAWQSIKEVYEKTGDEKLKWLHRSHRWLIGSFVVVLLLLVALAFLPPAPQAGPTPIIIVTPMPVVTPMPTP